MHSVRAVRAWTAVMAFGLPLLAGGQQQRNPYVQSPPAARSGTSQSPPNPSLTPLGADDAVTEHTARIEREQEKARNSDRQKRLVADTEKLLALATELKANVDKSNKDTMSVDVIRKADEIEKLAHSVKEKMKGS